MFATKSSNDHNFDAIHPRSYAKQYESQISFKYPVLCAFLQKQVNIHSTSPSSSIVIPSSSSKRLKELMDDQLTELLFDLCDEIDRRSGSEDGKHSFLPTCLEYSSKRNQARQKLANLSPRRFLELVMAVKVELDCRFPQNDYHHDTAFPSKDPQGNESISPTSSQDNDSYSSPVSNSLPMATYKQSQSTDLIRKGEILHKFPASRSEVNVDQIETLKPALFDDEHSLHINYDNNDANGMGDILADLDEMIGRVRENEIDRIKKELGGEIERLKIHIGSLENQLIPAKNQEIAKLCARLESQENKLQTLAKENERYKQALAENDVALEEQGNLLANLQASYLQLQRQLTLHYKSAREKTGARSTECLSNTTSPKSSPCWSPAIFRTLWAAFGKLQESASTALAENSNSTISDKVIILKESCAVAQRIVKAVEKFTEDLDADTSEALHRESRKIQTCKVELQEMISYCMITCKDTLEGKTLGDGKIRDACMSLKKCVEALIIIADSVSERFRLYCSTPVSTVSPTDPHLIIGNEQIKVLGAIDALESALKTIEGKKGDEMNLAGLGESIQKVIISSERMLNAMRENNFFLPSGWRNHAFIEDSIKQLRLILSQGLRTSGNMPSIGELYHACNTIKQTINQSP